MKIKGFSPRPMQPECTLHASPVTRKAQGKDWGRKTQGSKRPPSRSCTCVAGGTCRGAAEFSQGNGKEELEYWSAWSQFPKVFQLPCVISLWELELTPWLCVTRNSAVRENTVGRLDRHWPSSKGMGGGGETEWDYAFELGQSLHNKET